LRQTSLQFHNLNTDTKNADLCFKAGAVTLFVGYSAKLFDHAFSGEVG
jgi:hypothetical protein